MIAWEKSAEGIVVFPKERRKPERVPEKGMKREEELLVEEWRYCVRRAAEVAFKG